MENQNIYYPDYMYHYGVKGMKWGVRRYTNADGSLNDRGIKKYARAGYAQDSYNGNKTKLGKAYDKVTGAHKYSGDMMYNLSSKKANKARAEKYVADKEAAKAAKNTPEAKAARRKTALKIGAAAAGTALAAYGAYKVHNFVREKNQEIRVNEGKAKCDRMLKKLDRMRIHDLVTESSANKAWVYSGKRTSQFQYNNNGKTVTIPKQYRNTGTTLKPTQYRNIENKVIDKTISEAYDKARNDSFGTAAKNVYNYYRNRKK